MDMNITELARKHFAPIPLQPGDGFQLSYIDEFGKEHKLLTHIFDEATSVDTAVAFKADEFMGLKDVIGGAFGNGHRDTAEEV